MHENKLLQLLSDIYATCKVLQVVTDCEGVCRHIQWPGKAQSDYFISSSCCWDTLTTVVTRGRNISMSGANMHSRIIIIGLRYITRCHSPTPKVTVTVVSSFQAQEALVPAAASVSSSSKTATSHVVPRQVFPEHHIPTVGQRHRCARQKVVIWVCWNV